MLVTNLARFGSRELALASRLLNAISNGFPEDFDCDFDTAEVKIAFNPNSGDVFLTNNSYQVCVEEGGELFSYYSTPYNGLEGTFEDLLFEYKEMCPEDQEWFRELAEAYYSNYVLPVMSQDGVWIEEGTVGCYYLTEGETSYEEYEWNYTSSADIPKLFAKEENAIRELIAIHSEKFEKAGVKIVYNDKTEVWTINDKQASREDVLVKIAEIVSPTYEQE